MKTTSNFHSKNKHKSGYDFDVLCKALPKLTAFVFEDPHHTKTIDFADPKAVKALNTALMFAYYDIKYWEFPNSNLCPPIPGRVDYIHHLSDLLETSNIKKNRSVLDIGTGASGVYPLLGVSEYHWNFVGTDIDNNSLHFAQENIDKNGLDKSITLRYQKDGTKILTGVLNEADRFCASMCNPPFYKSEQEALEATTKKLKGLNKETDTFIRNFAGTQHELWYQGGEKAFIHNYLYESSLHKKQCFWFTSLVSKKDLVKGMLDSLKKLGATEIKTIHLGHGNKISRVVAWTFLSKQEQEEWV
ncbi:23S rRNA (adenine(1618)-N(6))-methyltransferase RlmF [Mariniflexile sp.]|uniref:23S rRNA (adenine(1618)-N(6))-methyltransferase RlmF n=1 Tax=Mariniflexile sp. TaxID=1979402 RepID=UPI004047EFC7